jgi:ubiquitin-conjugating enzyme (huntingtin interacting protein 2)
MTAPRDRRLLKELNDLKKDDGSGITMELPNEANLRHMHGYIQGPPDTPYVGGTFKVDIQLPEEYPFKPPTMTFLTKIWHPNVSSVTVRTTLLALRK